jgi:hypothetical protein
MKNGELLRRLLAPLFLTLILLGGSVLSAGTANAASTHSTRTASAETRVAWTQSVNRLTRLTSWSDVLAPTGCSVKSVTYAPVESPSRVAGASLAVEAAYVVANCGALENHANRVRPHYASACTTLQYWNGASVTDGYECVGTWTDAGQAYVGAEWTNESSGSVTGHEELGTPTDGCNSGDTVSNSVDKSIDVDDRAFAFIPTDASNDWSATFWAGTSSPYTSYGVVCGSY